MAIGDVFGVEMFYHCNQRVMSSSFYYRQVAGDESPLDASGLAVGFGTVVVPKFLAAFSDQTRVDCVIARQLTPVPTEIPVTSFLINANGLVVDDAVPDNAAGIITIRGVYAGGGGRRRVFVSGFAEADVNTNVFTSAMQTTELQDIVDQLLLNVSDPLPTGLDWEPVIVKNPADLQQPGGGLSEVAVVSNISFNPILKTLRSRQTRRSDIPV